MENNLGNDLAEFDASIRELREALSCDAELCSSVFSDADEWANLLSHKLVPHFAGNGCLIAAVTGGTNTGKSTVFNLLVGSHVSPVEATAAATRHPVLAGNMMRSAQCHGSKLVPEFKALPFEERHDVTSEDFSADSLFVAVEDSLPDQLVFLDTPDVDSIEKQNWTVADNIRAAGDVLIAVITPEKYKDERVVTFFRHALESGRLVIPVMNKANPENDYMTAMKHLEEFKKDVGTDSPCFVLPHDYELGDTRFPEISSVDGTTNLRTYLDSLDVHSLKQNVYRTSLEYFTEHASVFLEQAGEIGGGLRSIVEEFHTRAHSYASNYNPEPGSEVGGLFHSFVQSKRGPLRRVIGAAGATVIQGAKSIAQKIGTGILKRTTLESVDEPPTDEEISKNHRQQLESITRDLATSYIESSHNLREPASKLLGEKLKGIDIDDMVAGVVGQTVRTESVSDAFREHANNMLEQWWEDHKGKRRVLEALDTVLAAVPTAIAAPMSVYTGGVGVPEAVVVAGPIVEQFVARVLEYQFGDAMFDFLSPWQLEQQDAFAEALIGHLTEPVTEALSLLLDPFEGEIMSNLRRCHATCLKVS